LFDIRKDRNVRGIKIVRTLIELGVRISLDRVLEIAKGSSLGRPHIAYALVESGLAKHPKDAFDKFIGVGAPAYVPREVMTPFKAIDILNKNGAMPVLAHPMLSRAKSGREEIKELDELLPVFKERGLIGIEVNYGDYSSYQVNKLKYFSNKYGLIECGGSDYHAAGNPVETKPGEVGPSLNAVHEMKHLLSIRNGN
jgi:predicted metal-dependent phosphoesterase TrpH